MVSKKKGKEIQNTVMASSSEEEEQEEFCSSYGDKEKNAIVTLPIEQKPEKSKGKRSLAKANEETKTKNPPPFTRIFSEEDEIVLLEGVINFNANPFIAEDAFCDSVKGSISFNASNMQLLCKLRNIKRKFKRKLEKSLVKGMDGEDDTVFSNDVDHKSFQLCRKIWGREGILAKKRGMEARKLEFGKPKENPLLSSGREMISFLKAANSSAFSLDESTLLACWNRVVDGPKKRAVEERFLEIKALQAELCVEATALVASTASLLFSKQDACSFEKGTKLSHNEKRVRRDDGGKNSEVVPIVDEDEKDTCGEEPDSNDKKIEDVSALILLDQEPDDPKEGNDLEMENEEVDTVSNTGNKNEAPALENEDSCVASGGTKETCADPLETNVRKKDDISRLSLENKEVGTVSAFVTPAVIEHQAGENGTDPLVSKKILLVLDLNGLLADIVYLPRNYNADINIGGRAIFKRPFCEEFLKFCFDKFEVGIWSSRKQKNLKRIAEFLLGDMMSKLLFCWDMSHCTSTSLPSLENSHKFVVFKELEHLWEKHEPALPWKEGDYNERNTVLLDDTPYKAILNPPFTAIFPHSYNHRNKRDSALGNGGDLRLHLEKLAEAENVQDFIRQNPFGQEAITETSESWKYYKQAVSDNRW